MLIINLTNKFEFCFLGEANGLCHVLTVACPKPRPTMWDLSPQTRDQWEINRNELEFIRKLGSGNFGEVWYGKCKPLFFTREVAGEYDSYKLRKDYSMELKETKRSLWISTMLRNGRTSFLDFFFENLSDAQIFLGVHEIILSITRYSCRSFKDYLTLF